MLKTAQTTVRSSPSRPFKGVRSLMNATKTPESLEKGILRNKYDIFVYKDGTVRFDATNAPLTHFRPKDIGTPLSKLSQLGYTNDVDRVYLEREDQLVELLPQDVIIPENCGDYLLKVTNFVDDLLVNYYQLERYYNCKSKQDLIGHLILGLAPHTSVGILGRVIGYTPAHVCLAHPYWHSAKRRDCDGDGDSVMLLLDALLNFSKEYLPAQIGGLMDTPLLLQPIVIPSELQRQAHNFDIAATYPREFYEATLRHAQPKEVTGIIETIRSRLKSGNQFTGLAFTHSTSLINLPHNRSSYSTLHTFSEKLDKQMEVAMKIRAVDPNQVAASILRTHIIPDLMGNIRAYNTQMFRCKKCNRRYRRIPVIGKCFSCDGELQATVTQGAVEKYLTVAKELATRFEIDDYLRARLNKITEEIEEEFPPKEGGSQTTLNTFITQSVA
jgi:DNA polymerase II large subunit